ncbi:hypothetical protein ACFQRF_07505 [Marinactinospora rubrisoli]|uniref:Uncharacterized protein n=1 Tax=Marinactinospora rubrisoli TaxID=2715399 RepID=A0ABW2KBY6_9ACTN
MPGRFADYPAFAAVAARHHARWEVTHHEGEPVPYRARHRTCEITLASDDVEILGFALSAFEPASYVRPYLPRAEDTAR